MRELRTVQCSLFLLSKIGTEVTAHLMKSEAFLLVPLLLSNSAKNVALNGVVGFVHVCKVCGMCSLFVRRTADVCVAVWWKRYCKVSIVCTI